MRTNFKPVFMFSAVLVFAACVRVPDGAVEYVPPSVKKADLPKHEVIDFEKLFPTCDKPEADPEVLESASQNKLSFEDEIETGDVEFVGCEGQSTHRKHGPRRLFEEKIELTPPEGLEGVVHYAKVENTRTCVARYATVEQKANPLSTFIIEGDGRIKFSISDTPHALTVDLPLRDGANVVNVTYFGECTRFRDDRDDSKGEAYNCVERKELGKKTFLLELKVDRPEVDGVRTVNTCPQKKP